MTTRIYIPAGGKGERFFPLTKDRAKPAVPFGGKYRIIDFVLSNIYNSGLRNVVIPTQFLSRSLHAHIDSAWSHKFGESGIVVEPATMKPGPGEDWFQGTADSVWQSAEYLRSDLSKQTRQSLVNCAVFGADHIYKMDVRSFVDFFEHHRAAENAAGVVAVNKVPWERAAGQFGVVQVDDCGKIIGFVEKPADPARVPGEPDFCYASMGNYVWDGEYLLEALERDSNDANSRHDFGKNIIPVALAQHLDRNGRPLYAYDFSQNEHPGMTPEEAGYWEDVGSIDAYFESNHHLRSRTPVLDLYNPRWPIFTNVSNAPPAKYVGDHGEVSCIDSIIADGWIVSKATIDGSILFTCHEGLSTSGRQVYGKVERGAVVEESLLLGPNYIGRGARIRRAIIDKGVDVPDGDITVGHNRDEDLARGFTISAGGVTVVPKGYVFK